MVEESQTPDRRPYTGSCHCGDIRYILYLTLPPTSLVLPARSSSNISKSSVRIRKCNCSTCHKMSFFHVRVPNAPQDFMLLSPIDPMKELGDYTCFDW
ncbi:hypothetical protein EJ08DRAFT_722668 [Tothia fuscella]|uniref:CENP-V/GFA domain-containing protein n=1 Tax=Tothia fuscella TaxID=1048955 RepID=A0A9P4NL42_9PEZI|nr:hypothetical protein EJ08DRAFT_722668 [Tothia fuscella]